ncbi:MAG: ABC transporter permease, partial [Gemmatimonadaceae bacterium]|nr:ABC transporter permease [Gemmatimonadaceae bacterium]
MSEALLAFWQGAFGSWFAIASGTLVRATPLLVLGLAVTIAFRAGVINIGAEGQLMMGAVGATAIAFLVEGVPAPVALVLVLLGAALIGSAWSAVAAWLRARFGVLEVISTIMLN